MMITILILISSIFINSCNTNSTNLYKSRAEYTVFEQKSNTQANNIYNNDPELQELIQEEINTYYEDNPVFTEKDLNTLVYKWLNYFTTTNRNWFQRALDRSAKYEKPMKQILRYYGVPEDLFYLALIESGFNKKAHSKAGAKGIWQFMKGTARMYGLTVHNWKDERLSPYKSTAAAAAHLKDLYNLYGSWALAIASYNAGEFRIRKAILKSGSRDFWELASKGALPSETINYVPKFIAATIIAKSPEKFGFKYNYNQSNNPFSLSEYREVVANLSKYKRNFKPRHTPYRLAGHYYRVKRGDSLWKIAIKTRTTITKLKACNRLRGNTVYPGQKLYLNCKTRYKQKYYARKYNKRHKVRVIGRNKVYTVKRGDTLWNISKRFKTTIKELKRCNPHIKKAIYPGQKIRVKCAKLV